MVLTLKISKAPECFQIEKALRERMGIPVFHDDQHGTAIIVGAAALNGLEIIGKNIADVRLVVNGAGASAIACTNLLRALGFKKENITMCDSKGVISKVVAITWMKPNNSTRLKIMAGVH